MKKNKSAKRLIHIHAKSKIYEVFEVVEEDKAVERLENIRDNFLSLNARRGNEDKLKVSTVVINPTLF